MPWLTNGPRRTHDHRTPSGAWARRFAALVAVAFAAVLWLPAGVGAQIVGDERALGTNGAEVPVLDWVACPPDLGPEGYECTTAEVPLSYRDPAGPRIELALGRLPAGDPARRIGTLFWNPGGPGGPGRIPPAFTEALHERFDIVGFDPRGIAASTQLRCLETNHQAFEYFGWDFPITLTQTRRVIDLTRRGTDRCARNAGPILSHMATANVARDLDLLRQAVGDPQLSYFGYSYGTHIGTVYANLFPSRVRALSSTPSSSPSSGRRAATRSRPGSPSSIAPAASTAHTRRCARSSATARRTAAARSASRAATCARSTTRS